MCDFCIDRNTKNSKIIPSDNNRRRILNLRQKQKYYFTKLNEMACYEISRKY